MKRIGITLAFVLAIGFGTASAETPDYPPWFSYPADCEREQRFEQNPLLPCKPNADVQPTAIEIESVKYVTTEVQLPAWEEPEQSYCRIDLEVKVNPEAIVEPEWQHSSSPYYLQFQQEKANGTPGGNAVFAGHKSSTSYVWTFGEHMELQHRATYNPATGVLRVLAGAGTLDGQYTGVAGSQGQHIYPDIERVGSRFRVRAPAAHITYEGQEVSFGESYVRRGYLYYSGPSATTTMPMPQTGSIEDDLEQCIKLLTERVQLAAAEYQLEVTTREAKRVEEVKALASANELVLAEAVAVAAEEVNALRVKIAREIADNTAAILLARERVVLGTIEADKEINGLQIAAKQAELASLEKSAQWLAEWTAEKKSEWDELSDMRMDWALRIADYESKAQADLDAIASEREAITAAIAESKRTQATLQSQLDASDAEVADLRARLEAAQAELAEAERQYAELSE